jgi:hypothetical protein
MPTCTDELRRLAQVVATTTIVAKEFGGSGVRRFLNRVQQLVGLTATAKSGLTDFPSRMPSAIRMYSRATLKGSPTGTSPPEAAPEVLEAVVNDAIDQEFAIGLFKRRGRDPSFLIQLRSSPGHPQTG